jgi:hypothetical protein
MTALTWLITIALLALSPQFVFRHDRRNIDGERYVELCGGLYQRPETWVCVEIGR